MKRVRETKASFEMKKKKKCGTLFLKSKKKRRKF